MSKIDYPIQCEVCGKTFVLQVDPKDLDEYYDTPRNERRLVQEIFHYLTPQERELIMSLTCDDCWHRACSYQQCVNTSKEVDENDN